MKVIICVLVAFLGLAGCSSHHFDKTLNTPLSVNVGDSLASWSDWKTFTAAIEGELLYSGISGSTLKLQYREFVDGAGMMLARQPFFQELTYDLSKSDEIAFRDIKIKILSADSSKLAYEILSGPAPKYK